MLKLSGNIVDVLNQRVFFGDICIDQNSGKIISIEEKEKGIDEGNSKYFVPGLIDSHVHIESSMLVPTEFARLAVVHGTVAVVCDPHEITNVLGKEGMEYMIENARLTPLKIHFGAPSCVPATKFETNGGELIVSDIENLFHKHEEMVCLSEVMDICGVINKSPEILAKIAVARNNGKVVDGHAPGLLGDGLKAYIGSGVTTDHECIGKEEALEKIRLGMKIQIREGSAAKNMDDLVNLLDKNFQNCMLCSDDKHPDDLVAGHINEMVRRAISVGIDPLKVLWSSTIVPVQTYGLDKVGLLRENDPADFIVVDNLLDFNVLGTYIDGNLVAELKKTKLNSVFPIKVINNFQIKLQRPENFAIKPRQGAGEYLPVIEVIDKQLITKKYMWKMELDSFGYIKTNVEEDILKIVVLDRYSNDDSKRPAIGFVRNFGLKFGAIASSVAHDSHNIVGIGADDKSLSRAINLVIKYRGGISASYEDIDEILPLPIGGIMANDDAFDVAEKYHKIDTVVKQMGSKLCSPFMSLSFLCLLVIPHIKIGDMGIFDGDKSAFI